VNYSHRCPKGNRQMRRVLNQAANAGVKARGTIFASWTVGSSHASAMPGRSARSPIGVSIDPEDPARARARRRAGAV
jgi:L-fucose isomerase-like protein